MCRQSSCRRRYRLTVRTEPSQGLNTGSIPVSATNSLNISRLQNGCTGLALHTDPKRPGQGWNPKSIPADGHSLPKFTPLQPKSVDQSRKRGWLLPPTWVVKEKAWEHQSSNTRISSPLSSCGITRSSDTKARPMPSIAARATVSTSSTIRGPLTATDKDFFPLSNSHRNRMAHGRGRNAKPLSGARKASLLRYDEEGGQGIEIVVFHL